MLYSFLSESGVLDISLLALSTGIIVLSILGLLHLGKRRGHNKAGHFSEQPDDCAMPAVQTENSDGWPSMEQPQTTELVSVVAAPEDSSNLDSPPSETVADAMQRWITSAVTRQRAPSCTSTPSHCPESACKPRQTDS